MIARGRLNRLILLPTVMVALGLLAFILYPRAQGSASPVCALSQTGQAPSGRTLSLCQTLTELQPSGDLWAVVRVLDPALPTGGIPDHGDHDWACATWGLPLLEADPRADPRADSGPARIVVQIMAQPFARGEPAPGVAQSIEAYSIAQGTCQWELL